MNGTRLIDYIDHMRRAAVEACGFVKGLTKDEFLADRRTQQAVIIGEAATKVMEGHAAFIRAHPEVLWRNMRGMRNRMAHGYFDINLDVVWETVLEWLPQLLRQLSAVRLDADDRADDDRA